MYYTHFCAVFVQYSSRQKSENTKAATNQAKPHPSNLLEVYSIVRVFDDVGFDVLVEVGRAALGGDPGHCALRDQMDLNPICASWSKIV